MLIAVVVFSGGFVIYNAAKDVDAVYDSVDLASVPTRTSGTSAESNRTSKTENPVKPIEQNINTVKSNALEGSYKLIDVQGKKVLSEKVYTLVISTDRIIGQICNSYNAEYTATKNSLVVDGLISTKMACLDESGEYENIVFEILRNKPTFAVKNGVLRLSNGNKNVLFKKE